MKKVAWGVLSTAAIGVNRVIPAMMASQHCDVRAIASRDLAKAKKVAADLGIPKAYGSYEELLADPEIEAIYNPLPNHLHVPMTIKAAKAGKHVLCEKPIGTSAKDAEALRSVADKVIIMEGFMVRWHPRWHRVMELVREGAIGDVRAMQVVATFFVDYPNNIRNRLEVGGGCLMDIGVYPIALSRMVFGGEPKRVIAIMDRDPRFGTDRLTSCLLDYGDGRRLDYTCSTQMVVHQEAKILGTKGLLDIISPITAMLGAETKIIIDDGSKLGGASAREEVIPACNHFAVQGDAFSEAVRGERKLPYDVEDAIRNMRVLDALYRSEKSGTWETV